jgi:hypothetical protein
VSEIVQSDPVQDAGYFSWTSWLARLASSDRRDRAANFARRYPAGTWPGLERPLGWAEADQEYRAWADREYPRSRVALQEIDRIRASKNRTAGPRPEPDLQPVSVLEATEALVAAFGELLLLVDELLSLKAPELQHRPRRDLARLQARIRAIRRIRPE